MTIEEWKERNSKPKKYSHFDRRKSVDFAWEYISNPKNIASHGFYPFIQYHKKYKKYNKCSKNNGVKIKDRKLCYAAHMDRYIYSYYGFLLNEKYNKYVISGGFSDSAVAYRTDLKKNNIHFAKRAIDFIRSHSQCHIIVGDFTEFFDRLDHKYLKKQLCNLMGCKTLPSDYYAIYKNITKYSTWDLTNILCINQLRETKSGKDSLDNQATVLTPEQFKMNKKENINPNKESYGIPQGSPISAILSNIYMLDFDKQIHQFVKQNNGIYIRYSDDFIIVLPIGLEISFADQLEWIKRTVHRIEGLYLQEEKTQIFIYKSDNIENISTKYLNATEGGKDLLNYLGFTFDGKIVTIRDKTISKYYYRMHRKAKHIINCNGITKKGNRINNKELYRLYSIKGAYKGNGNFLTYVRRAEKEFGRGEAITRGTKKHLKKIRDQLNKIPPV